MYIEKGNKDRWSEITFNEIVSVPPNTNPLILPNKLGKICG